ncbi:MAG TPA: M48 family metallopeptidase [Candidatus Acidoferrum sp.]|nr:M48 family metallopeptidase [Candidatus Acidoferrum sp.]
MPILQDKEFGSITLRRSRLARVVRLKVDTHGRVSMSMPMRAPLYLAKQLLEDSRPQLRRLLADAPSRATDPLQLKALRKKAKEFLPSRLQQLAAKHGFSYQKSRLSSAGTRWGSCSSRGTISLNIYLMTLPSELIDYVIIHELCHTKHMNHSRSFWQLVAAYCPDYKQLRRLLKQHRPAQN